jgi:hypothetical protein
MHRWNVNNNRRNVFKLFPSLWVYSNQPPEVKNSYTFDAIIFYFKVRLEVVMTRSDVVKVVVKHSNATRSSAGAMQIECVSDVRAAPDVPEVRANASADMHSTVASISDHDDLRLTTLDPEVL